MELTITSIIEDGADLDAQQDAQSAAATNGLFDILAIRCPIDAQILIDQVKGLGCNPGFMAHGIRTADDAERLATQSI